MKKTAIFAFLGIAIMLSCGQGRSSNVAGNIAANSPETNPETAEAVAPAPVPVKTFSPSDVVIEKKLLYDQHTLADSFPYEKGMRRFQFDKMRARLFMLDSIQQTASSWGVLQNRKNWNGTAPTVRDWTTDEYHSVSDRFGVQRSQSAPLYVAGEKTPERYGRDGSLVKLLGYSADSTAYRLESYNAPGIWEVPFKYVKPLDAQTFSKVVMVDRTNQVIATLERTGQGRWLVRSMNPCTTGLHRPPYAHPTPVGLFLIQDHTSKMLYTHDGSSELAGYAPWASRFTNGAFIHGVPTNSVNAPIIEFSQTLGTTPRSHECVRNASSHSKFIYDWALLMATAVFVYD